MKPSDVVKEQLYNLGRSPDFFGTGKAKGVTQSLLVEVEIQTLTTGYPPGWKVGEVRLVEPAILSRITSC